VVPAAVGGGVGQPVARGADVRRRLVDVDARDGGAGAVAGLVINGEGEGLAGPVGTEDVAAAVGRRQAGEGAAGVVAGGHGAVVPAAVGQGVGQPVARGADVRRD